ncbi:MAG: glycosyltransferase family 4 protein [Bacteroidales bacterium]|nr:glycosyltransferase family 4 protein [Bacteroidales bacterium]MCF8336524.1 glycosyltransferase family 4 protein [Bacteroidales bacterium]
MNKIKVLEAIRQGKIGGGESHVLELVKNLDKSIYEPVVLSFTDGPMIEALNKAGIKCKIIYTEKPFDVRIWKSVREYMEEEDIKLVHAHGTRAMSNVFKSAQKLNLPLLYTVHGWAFHSDQFFPKRKTIEQIENFLTRQANLTINVSKSNQQEGIRRFGLSGSQVIYNAVNLEKFNANNYPQKVREELGITHEQIVIGYIGRITVQKDPFTMVRAMEYVKSKSSNTILLMVGDGELKSEVEQLTQKLDMTDKVIFQPFRTDIPSVLDAIDIYCLPSLWEGFPIGILEAMAMKKAVVASHVGGTKELIYNGETGYLVPQSQPQQLAETLLRLINDEALRKKTANNGYEFVRKNFDIHQFTKKVEKIYAKYITS